MRKLLNVLARPERYDWVALSGSQAGFHVWVLCTDLLPADSLRPKSGAVGVYSAASGRADFHHLELRWRGCQTLVPPSQHPSGLQYRWHQGVRRSCPPAVVTAEQVVAAFRALTVENPKPGAHHRAVISRGQTRAEAGQALELKLRFSLVEFAQQHWTGELVEEGREVRLLGHGGLLINEAAGIWFCFWTALAVMRSIWPGTRGTERAGIVTIRRCSRMRCGSPENSSAWRPLLCPSR